MTNSRIGWRRILLVEDDEDSRDLVKLNLTGCLFKIARDFKEGIRLARQRYFDLYILDNLLPDGTGVELCQQIRMFDPYTPVIFMSALAYDYDINEALGAGAQMYITKPSDYDGLQLAVMRLISIARENAFHARLAELAVVREELTIQYRERSQRVEQAKMYHMRAREKALRAKAELAFLAAKGTRGDFARLWPTIFIEEVCNHRDNLGEYIRSRTPRLDSL